MVDVDPALPTLGRSRARSDNGGYYLLCQPGRLAITIAGGSSSGFTKALTAVAVLIPVVFFIAVLVQSPGHDAMSWFAAVFAALIVACLCVVAALPLMKLVEYLDKGRERRRPAAFARVTRKDELAWQMCETVHELATCRSWVDRTVDPQRRIPVLLWAAVRRSVEVETQRAALVSVAENLRAIRDAASQVDRTRNQRVRQQQAARDEQLEERQLRSALLGTSTSAAPEHSENRADAAAGLAAEAETIAVLLADTDRLLTPEPPKPSRSSPRR